VDTGRFSGDTSVFAHGAKVTVAKTVVDPQGRAEWAGVELACVPVLGEFGEYRDTGCFSWYTSVFAHGAKVTVAKTVVETWGKAEGAGVESAGAPVLRESWGVCGHRSFLREHFKIVIQNSSCVVCHRVQPL
jgi:hypothetical protein